MRSIRLLLLVTLVCACGSVQARSAEPSFPAPAPMPAITVPSFDETTPVQYGYAPTSIEAVPASATAEAEVSKKTWRPRSLGALGRSVSRGAEQLFAQQRKSPNLASSAHHSSSSAKEMIDIEATLQLVVESVVPAATSLRSLAHEAGAMITEEVVEEGATANAHFTVRVDADKAYDFLAACERLGQTRSRQINARDIGKEYHDTELLLANLEAAMRRYEEVLKGASQVTDVLAVERELGRLRAQIDRVKGTLLWMQDRVSRSTVHVYLASLRTDSAALIVSEAKIYPGVRLAYLQDFRGDGQQQGYLGVGLSLRLNRAIGIDVDGLRRNQRGFRDKGMPVFLATLGGEVFSDFLGGGRRRYLNPYLGWRLGYARFESHSEFAFAGVIGFELIKTRAISVDLAGRLFGLIGKSAHMAVEPVLSANVAF